MNLDIRPAQIPDAQSISELINRLAHYFLVDPTAETAKPFLATITNLAVSERIEAPNFDTFVAESDAELCGVVVLRDQSHLYHLFVDPNFHRRGVARALWERVRDHSQSTEFTVNSTLFAVPVYERFGFLAIDSPQTKNGLVFVPMTLTG